MKSKLTKWRSYLFGTQAVDSVSVSPEFLKALIQCADSLRKVCQKKDSKSIEIGRMVLQHLDSLE